MIVCCDCHMNFRASFCDAVGSLGTVPLGSAAVCGRLRARVLAAGESAVWDASLKPTSASCGSSSAGSGQKNLIAPSMSDPKRCLARLLPFALGSW